MSDKESLDAAARFEKALEKGEHPPDVIDVEVGSDDSVQGGNVVVLDETFGDVGVPAVEEDCRSELRWHDEGTVALADVEDSRLQRVRQLAEDLPDLLAERSDGTFVSRERQWAAVCDVEVV